MAAKRRRSSEPAIHLPRNGPISAPRPRAPMSSPMPVAPAPNTFSANTEISTSTPAARPKPPFTLSNASTRWSRRAYRAVSRVASRTPGCSRGRSSENGRRMRHSNAADSTNEAASMTKAASMPSVATTTPPRAAPTASIVPHAEPSSEFGGGQVVGLHEVRDAAAWTAGSNATPKADRSGSSTKTSQKVSELRANRKHRQTTARARSHAIIRWRRSRRSARIPPSGDSRKNGISCAMMTRATATALPWTSSARSNRATVRNQSPPSEMMPAANRRLKSRLRRRSRRLARGPVPPATPAASPSGSLGRRRCSGVGSRSDTARHTTSPRTPGPRCLGAVSPSRHGPTPTR